MNVESLQKNERKILIYLLKQLEKRIYLLRVSLYGDAKKYFPDGVRLSKNVLQTKNDEFEANYKIAADDYRLMVDSCEIETCIRRLLHEMTEMKTFKTLKEIVLELEYESTAFNKHKKMIKAKRKQIDHLNEVLPILREQAKVTAEHLKKAIKSVPSDETEEKLDSYGDIAFLKKLTEYKVESKKTYYEHREMELKESIKWFEQETRTQEHTDRQTTSFWLLKYNDYSEKIDMMLKQTFDNWSAKRRELEILKKYRTLNMEKIQKLRKLILEREDYIEKDIAQKKEAQRKREEELRRQMAATQLQAYWRGTMVRKQLGPYKVKKSKKGKGKKGKGKKK